MGWMSKNSVLQTIKLIKNYKLLNLNMVRDTCLTLNNFIDFSVSWTGNARVDGCNVTKSGTTVERFTAYDLLNK